MALVLAVLWPALSQDMDLLTTPAAGAAGKPITTADGPAAELLRKWWAEGAVAGNVGDRYDNRDRGHSRLDITAYPQLGAVDYPNEDRQKNLDFAAQTAVQPGVVFGNSSTSAPVLQGGSNTRQYYTYPQGLPFLFTQYVHNNLYIYPEHQDHDPGHNGVGAGYGDVYPTNTPYLITSQGSSGSDQPFLSAIALTLAAFRPEVKQKLVQTGLLMPTLQMILRCSGKQLAESPTEPAARVGQGSYLSGRAHPSAFEGSWLDELEMVKMAHDIRPDNIPPLAVLKVVEEDSAEPGRDFFDGAASEKLADTPGAVARFFRGAAYKRRMVVSAEQSVDVNQLPLTYHWVVLRGDADRIRITPRNQQGSAAEIVVPYHDRGPVIPGSALESNRVDIGVFVHNGTYFSAPAFITFYGFDWEGRTYDADGRLLDIGYDLGTSEVSVSNWSALLEIFKSDSLAGHLLREGMRHDELLAARQAAAAYETAGVAPGGNTALAQISSATLRGKMTLAADREASAEAAAAAADALKRVRPPRKVSVQALLERRLVEMMRDIDFLSAHENTLLAIAEKDLDRQSVLRSVRKELVGYGMAPRQQGERWFAIAPIRTSPAPLSQRLTRFERATVERLNADVLSGVVYKGAVTSVYRLNYVDPRLSSPKHWRDVYRYDAHGNGMGWTRYDGEVARDYNRAGERLLQKDARGRCIRAGRVKYELDPKPAVPSSWDVGPYYRPIKAVDTGQVVLYEYAGDEDFVGKVRSGRGMPAQERLPVSGR